jgi:hypothetical protein
VLKLRGCQVRQQQQQQQQQQGVRPACQHRLGQQAAAAGWQPEGAEAEGVPGEAAAAAAAIAAATATVAATATGLEARKPTQARTGSCSCVGGSPAHAVCFACLRDTRSVSCLAAEVVSPF